MPLYEYECPACGSFTAFARMADSACDAPCAGCGASAPRLMSAPRLAGLPRPLRRAMDRSEASAHEPQLRSAHSDGQRHDHRHSHEGQHRHTHGQSLDRPWMIGH